MRLEQLYNEVSALRVLKRLFFYGEPPTLDSYRHRPRHGSSSEGGFRLKGEQPRGFENGNPLVSIITVVRNSEQTLGRTIKSVQEQTYQPIEHIVIDGASKDRTLDIVRSYESGIAYWLSEPDRGIYDAFNKGVATAHGQLIEILNADDWLSPDQIEQAVKSLLDSDAPFVFGDIWLHGWKGQDLYMRGEPHYGALIQKTMPPIYHTTMLFRNEVFQKVGLFRTIFKIASDYDWLIRVHLNGFRGIYNPSIVGHMQAGGKSTTLQHLAICEGFVASVKNGHPLLPSLRHWGYRFIFVNGVPPWVTRLTSLWRGGLALQTRTRPFLSSPRKSLRRVLIGFADRTGLFPRLKPYRNWLKFISGHKADLLRLQESDGAVSGSGQKREFLQVFLDARSLYGGLPDIGIEWFYRFGTSIKRALCLDDSRLGKQVMTVLEGAGVIVERYSGNNGENMTEWMRNQRRIGLSRFDAIILDNLLPKNPVLPILSGQLSQSQTVIFISTKDEQSVQWTHDLIPSKNFGNVVVLENPPLSLLRR